MKIFASIFVTFSKSPIFFPARKMATATVETPMETDNDASTADAQQPKKAGKVNRKRRRHQIKNVQPNQLLQILLNKLKGCKKGEEMTIMLDTLQPSVQDLAQKYSVIKKDLEKMMNRVNNKNYEVLVFGSAVTGLAFKDSDFDFYINCGASANKDASIKMINKLSGGIAKSEDGGFRQAIRITGARVPILRCHHIKTGIVCDINFLNSMGVFNSAFLNYICNFHQLIHPLAMLVKFWTRCQGPSFKILNSYCIINMLIYYLQQLKFPLLPPIIMFQEGIPENQIGPWNFAWNLDFPNISKNKCDVWDLLAGFFKFYSSFAYERYVISPLYAKVFPRQQFENNFFEDNEQARYKFAVETLKHPPLQLKASLCVQDPFELNANIGKATPAATLENWKTHCRFAAKICEDFLKNRSSGVPNMLTKLFTEFPSLKPGAGSSLPLKQPMLEAIEKCAQYTETSTEYVLQIAPLGHETYVIKQILLKSLTATNPKGVLTQLEINQFWAEQFIKFLIDTFFIKLFGFTAEQRPYKSSGLPKVHYSTATKSDEEMEKEALAKLQVAGANETANHVSLYRINSTVDSWSGRRKILYTDTATMERELKSAEQFLETCKTSQSATVVNTYLKIVCGPKYEFVALEFYDCVGTRKRSGLKTFFKNSLMRDSRQCLKGHFQILQANAAKVTTNGSGNK
jgi:DNA polymerase sigma